MEQGNLEELKLNIQMFAGEDGEGEQPPSDPQPKGLTQEEFDAALNKRMAREREGFAKSLGLETYSEESLKSFLETVTAKDTKIAEYETKQKELQTEMRTRDFKIHAMTNGIDTQHVDKAIKLAQMEMESNGELDMEKAFANVLEDFPMFKGTKTPIKVGDKVDNKVDEKTDIDKYLEGKYKNSKYFTK